MILFSHVITLALLRFCFVVLHSLCYGEEGREPQKNLSTFCYQIGDNWNLAWISCRTREILWSMKQNFRKISLETLDTWDFVGFFLNFCCFVFSPATSQEGVEQPARPQELSRAHVLTSSRRRGSHLNIYRILSMLFDVWYILLSQSLSLWPRRSSDPFFIWIVSLCHVILIYHGYHDVLWWIWLNDWMMNYVVLEVVCCSNLQQYAAFYDGYWLRDEAKWLAKRLNGKKSSAKRLNTTTRNCTQTSWHKNPAPFSSFQLLSRDGRSW